MTTLTNVLAVLNVDDDCVEVEVEDGLEENNGCVNVGLGLGENSEVAVVVLAGNNEMAVGLGVNNDGGDVSISGFMGTAGEKVKEVEGSGREG